MPDDTADLLELLSTSRSHWRSLRANGREWRNSSVLDDAWQAQLARKRAEGQHFQTISFETDVPEPEEAESHWQLWIDPPWKRAKFEVGHDPIDVVFRDGFWWSNGHGFSMTNNGDPHHGHGEGPGEDLVRTSDYVPLIDVEDVSRGTWIGRHTLNARIVPRHGTGHRRGPGLHGLIIGDPDQIILNVDQERGVILRVDSRIQGTTYRLLEITDVTFDEVLDPRNFEIQPLPGLGWSRDNPWLGHE